MREIKSFAGTTFLVWFIGSPILSLVLFATFNDQFRAWNLNFFWLLGIVFVLLGLTEIIILKFSKCGILGNQDGKTTNFRIALTLAITFFVFYHLIRQLL